MQFLHSVLWHCWLGARTSTRPVKIEWWGVGADCFQVVLEKRLLKVCSVVVLIHAFVCLHYHSCMWTACFRFPEDCRVDSWVLVEVGWWCGMFGAAWCVQLHSAAAAAILPSPASSDAAWCDWWWDCAESAGIDVKCYEKFVQWKFYGTFSEAFIQNVTTSP